MVQFFRELKTLWARLELTHKIVTLSVSGFFLFLFILIFFSSPTYVLLFPEGSLQPTQKKEIITYLNRAKIPFKEKRGVGLLVDQKEASRARMELSTLNIAKKGEESFDFLEKGSWLRGERELQLLEMKAIKHELEKDIASFQGIRGARVFIDMGTPSRLRANSKPKASVILTLADDHPLSQTMVFAIAAHVAAATSGLEANRVAISDTKGKIYQTMNEGSQKHDEEPLLFEERMKAKATELLTSMIGSHFSLMTTYCQGKLGFSLIVDEKIRSQKSDAELEKQLRTLFSPFGVEVTLALSNFPTEKSLVAEGSSEKRKEAIPYELFFVALFFMIVTGTFFFFARWFFSRRGKKVLDLTQSSSPARVMKQEILTQVSLRREVDDD